MNWLKNILGRIFALWAMIIFVITMIIFGIPIWILGLWPEPVRTRLFCRVSRLWMRIFFFLVGLRISIKGEENFKKGANYIIVSNHNSLMDIPLTTPFLPGPNKTIAKVEMARIPLFGMIYKRGSVLVDRKSEESRRASIQAMKQVLDMGLHMCIYPEGTRNKTGRPMQPFHNGAFRLAADTQKPILPTLIFNTAKVLPISKTFFFWPVRVEMHFLPAVEPGSLSQEELKQQVFELMQSYYVSQLGQ